MIHCSAPASTLLIGEHSVLVNQSAVVAALEPRLHVKLVPQSTQQIIIRSALAHHETTLNELIDHPKLDHPKLRFVIATIRIFQQEVSPLFNGFTLTIESSFQSTIGFGSSAAVTVALLRALEAFTENKLSQQQRWQLAKKIIVNVQKTGSGADACASVYGGICCFNQQQGWLSSLTIPASSPVHWHLYYCGYKTPTAEVLQKVAKKAQTIPDKFNSIYQQMGQLTQQFIQSWQQQNWEQVAQIMTAYQQQMQQLGVSDPTLDNMISTATDERDNKSVGAKISGSGLGDCILVMNNQPTKNPNLNAYPHYPLMLENKPFQGVQLH